MFDAEHALQSKGNLSTTFTEGQTCERVLKCHRKRTKRIITEESPDAFLTVAEVHDEVLLCLTISALINLSSQDGAVIQHDLRTSHRCDRDRGTCPPPLVKLPFDLSTIALSPLAPYLIVVAGEAPHVCVTIRCLLRHHQQAYRDISLTGGRLEGPYKLSGVCHAMMHLLSLVCEDLGG